LFSAINFLFPLSEAALRVLACGVRKAGSISDAGHRILAPARNGAQRQGKIRH
jgi:hypothetical protein